MSSGLSKSSFSCKIQRYFLGENLKEMLQQDEKDEIAAIELYKKKS